MDFRAVIVNGQHIFTFDGRHLTFPGTCRYILAHDYVDRNFSLAIQLQAGAPKAYILVDRSGRTVEIKDNGQVILDGQAHGFPVVTKDLMVLREPNGAISFGSKDNIMVKCSQNKFEVGYDTVLPTNNCQRKQKQLIIKLWQLN
ncbi:hypothetical protein evm_004675 [Chilo suppressalis]|nr:hypothetical protein evm_004675 [Chilo suppressalis]